MDSFSFTSFQNAIKTIKLKYMNISIKTKKNKKKIRWPSLKFQKKKKKKKKAIDLPTILYFQSI